MRCCSCFGAHLAEVQKFDALYAVVSGRLHKCKARGNEQNEQRYTTQAACWFRRAASRQTLLGATTHEKPADAQLREHEPN